MGDSAHREGVSLRRQDAGTAPWVLCKRRPHPPHTQGVWCTPMSRAQPFQQQSRLNLDAFRSPGAMKALPPRLP